MSSHPTRPKDPDDWVELARCREVEPETFFPMKSPGRHGDNDYWRDAVRICSRCEVKAECLAYVMSWETTADSYGVWGGTTAEQRNEMRRKGYQRRSAS